MATNFKKYTENNYADLPAFKTAQDEANFRNSNPTHGYTKEIEMRYARHINDAMKNNTGVTDAQMQKFNNVNDKWNLNYGKYNQDDALQKQQNYVNSLYGKG